MFYWMRLFKATAKYVTLITETLTDLTYFMIMVVIIIQAFATFFYIINLKSRKKYYLLLPGTPEQILLRKTLVTFFVEQAQKGWQSQLCLFLKNQLVFFFQLKFWNQQFSLLNKISKKRKFPKKKKIRFIQKKTEVKPKHKK